MHISFALFADAANLSQEGKLNILGVFDAVQVAGFPAVHPRANIVLRVKGTQTDVGSHAVNLRWLNPTSFSVNSINTRKTPDSGVGLYSSRHPCAGAVKSLLRPLTAVLTLSS
jgi:hypothetical protein